ncbi:RNA 2',3'-cyclic phosphodiesterase [Calidifontibacillus erzurumensis]|uniref:RNA 2',3'-cyclic phosphodiesterase n=1 Tax=Calidifontibacillus erzurumensis TaxID=2741433 RepID=A0A8J8GCL8_9BACI|nr:RNA 2',3'-cyclic phosphodiesterase [Calidifontibacillus erzurumensis]NSL50937.1 RNA 2',3'-cyclic phosphodiesterase [Calidifontibacillus erzurumensis]
MTKLPHYFIAIPLPEYLQDFFSIWQTYLKEEVSYKIWTYKKDLHITLKFLGPVDQQRLVKLQEELTIIEKIPSFTVEIGTLGTFGNLKEPRVIWAGVEKTKELASLQQQIENCAINVGFQKENREYRPHITLGKKWTGNPDHGKIEKLKSKFLHDKQKLHIDQVVIYRIFPERLQKYEVIESYLLGKN